jgi:anti-sigma factor RsiW
LKPDLCATIQACFSAYLDGAVSGHQMQEISRHLLGSGENEDCAAGVGATRVAPCEACAREFAAWRLTQDAIAMLRPAKAPADLGLKLRVAISREQARRGSRLRDSVSLAWDNTVRPMLLQVTAGIAGSVVLVGSIMLLLGVVAAPQAVLANDEPLGAMTVPHFRYSTAAPGAIITGYDAAIIVEASVNSAGRVYDYTIVSGPQDDAVRIQIANQLLGSVFEPASVFGLPVRGRVVLTFAGISVHG